MTAFVKVGLNDRKIIPAPGTDHLQLVRVRRAARQFFADTTMIRTGWFFCSASPDGVFEIGSRVPADAVSALEELAS